MSAIELFHQDGRAAGIFYCSECRVVHKSATEAENCHGERKCECGQPIDERFRNKCRGCLDREWQQHHDAKEAERFSKATKVSASDYNGHVYDGDRYFTEVDELREHYEDNDDPIPEYVWACKNVGVRKARLDDITERILENMWEDADHSDLNGVDELKSAIDKFNEANRPVCVYEPDYTTAVLVGEKQ